LLNQGKFTLEEQAVWGVKIISYTTRQKTKTKKGEKHAGENRLHHMPETP